MFVAKRVDGTFITLLDYENGEQLERDIIGGEFQCPACGSEVRLKNGAIRRLHFAHIQTECKASTEAETLYHLDGKAKLFQLLQHYGKAQLETFITQTKQRADIFLSMEEKKYAFEFQCSSLPIPTLEQRTDLYKSQFITPIWVIGKEKLGPLSNQMKLSPFQWSFVQNHSSGSAPYLLSFCPQQSKFFYLFPRFSFNSLDTTISYQVSTEWELTPTPSFNQIQINSKTKWLYDKKMWRYKYCLYKSNQPLRHFCYSKMKIPLSLVPAEIGIPVPSSYWFQSPVIQWQAWLYFDSIYHTPVDSIIHLPSVIHRFNQRIKKSTIRVKQLPLVEYGNYEEAIVEYLHLLVSLNVLKKENETIFRKRKKELPYIHLEEALGQDTLIMEKVLARR
ncbi:competence protein CoiA [Sutcliffiella deserti]|uniref:competence protein CoiA n=1 Tax=Sutcliffiella deserti TaxID=2875501 RepID=UPI001CBCD887|nr:competence protein CoiA family protein [Sutcliffiella deserti]